VHHEVGRVAQLNVEDPEIPGANVKT
jgi:hypothetical protein